MRNRVDIVLFDPTRTIPNVSSERRSYAQDDRTRRAWRATPPEVGLSSGLVFLAVLQGAATVVLLWRLLPGIRRTPPVRPRHEPVTDTSVSVLVPTLNEAGRLAPCLAALARQGAPLTEIIVVDSGSTDGTQTLVHAAADRDARVRLEQDPPLPASWIGKVWALQHGLSLAKGDWILGVDADTEANDGMVAGVVAAAREHDLALVSFAPMFAGQTSRERWLQPSLLVTLLYRTGVPSPAPPTARLLANGQCFLVRRETLLAHGGYQPARASFADDVFLARHYADAGVRCGFLDGRRLFRVRSYHSAGEMWREWGRSVDLADASAPSRQLLDLVFLVLVQGIPLPLIATSTIIGPPWPLVAVNLAALLLRLIVLVAIRGSYEERGVAYALSWIADPLAVFRVVLSTFRRPVTWRGRAYREIA